MPSWQGGGVGVARTKTLPIWLRCFISPVSNGGPLWNTG